MLTKKISSFHSNYVLKRRCDILSTAISQIIPSNISALDVGCGDGVISRKIISIRNDMRYQGLEISPRPSCAIHYKIFNGKHIPYNENSFDLVQFIDVLHHTNGIKELLQDSIRVSNKYILIKDHEYKYMFDFLILKFMDWFGNAPYGVNVIYNFKKRSYWMHLFEELNLEIVYSSNSVPLYQFPFNMIFGRNLHFITLLKKKN